MKSTIIKNHEKKTIGCNTSFYFQDRDVVENFKSICDEHNLRYSQVINTFMIEFYNKNKKK